MLAQNQIDAIREFFKAQPVLKAYLFGSQVNGIPDAHSDIDILVELDYSQRIGLQFIRMKSDLEKLLQAKVDLVSEKGLSKYMKSVINREKSLYILKTDFLKSKFYFKNSK